MKKLMKALGFLLLMAVTYLISSLITGAAIGGYLSIKNVALMNNEGFDAFNDALMSGMVDLMMPMLIAINVITLGLIMLYFLGRKDKFFKFVQFKRLKPSDGLCLFVLGIFMNLFLIGCLNYVTQWIPMENQLNEYAELMETMFKGNFVLILLALTVSAPLFEEIVFRGIVLNDFRKAVPLWVALVIQALAFGIMHMNMIQGSYAFILGLILGMVYIKYKSIWAPIIVHFSFNMTSTLLSQMVSDAQIEKIIFGMMMLGLIGTAGMVFVLINQYDAQAYPEPLIEVDEVTELEVIDLNEIEEVVSDHL